MQILRNRLEKSLARRQETNSFRSLKAEIPGVDFSSNDYLGFARNQELAARMAGRHSAQFVANGAGGSRLITGNSAQAEALEAQLARFFKAEASLLFGSGYMANLGLLSSVPQKGDTILYDELAHACIKDGARLSMAHRYSFKHNDADSLRKRLRMAEGQVFVVVESVYSMDGDQAPLEQLALLCLETGAALIVDEAHSTGIYGEGSGLVCALGLEKTVFARIHTFGKAMGSHGACIAGDELLRSFLINFARTFIYTTALPPHTLLSLETAMTYLQENIHLLKSLQDNIALFNKVKKELLSRLPEEQLLESSSPVQGIVIPGNQRVKEVAAGLQQKGYDVRPILSPTVAEGKERLRICLHTFNTKEEIEDLVHSLVTIL